MSRATALQTSSMTQSLAAAFSRLLPDRAEAEQAGLLAEALFHNAAASDLQTLSADQSAGLAVSLWRLAQNRPQGKPLVRAFTPAQEEQKASQKDGWSLPHSILETVNDDMPFLVDSVASILQQHGLAIHLLLHPVICVERDNNGVLRKILPDEKGAPVHGHAESLMHVQFDAISDKAKLDEIVKDIENALTNVRLAVTDWKAVLSKVDEAVATADRNAKEISADEIEEGRAFLRWLADNHFTFLGYRDYVLEGTQEKPRMAVRPGSGLGILRDDTLSMFEGLRNREDQPDEARNLIHKKHLLFVTKTTNKSVVHRNVHMDGIFVKTFDSAGNVNGERLFVGLLTSVAYSRNASEIPLLRRKVATVLSRADFNPHGHDGKALTHILNTYPRDELFQIGVNELYNIAFGILQLQERQRVALFLRRDPFERSFTALVYAPRDRYDTQLRQTFISILEKRLDSKLSSFELQIDAGPLARLYIILRTKQGAKTEIDVPAIERELAEASRLWSDRLKQALVDRLGEAEGTRLFRKYGAAFPASFSESFSPTQAVDDVRMLEWSRTERRLGIRLYRDERDDPEGMRLRLYHVGAPIMLSATLPMIENIGLRVLNEHGPHEIVPSDASTADPATHIWIHDYHTRLPQQAVSAGVKIDLTSLRGRFEESFDRIWYAKVEDDRFNRLVLVSGLNWKEANLLRAMGKYLRQAAFAFQPETMADTLSQHPQASRLLIDLFKAQLDPNGVDPERAASINAELTAYIKEIANPDEDRILRRYLNLVHCILRTNYWQQKDGRDKPYLSFKLDSRRIDDLPLPRPLYEVFVYSPRVEAVHLRNGLVARGGIRWSDRLEDFRTEVLGLMKAQVVKNTVIVPTGSKGGFVVKQPDPNFPQQEGIACYRTMMRGLLDITDNVVNGKIVPPQATVRRDGDDPYLVVAADKGTATFSDIANEISHEYDFWLDDAFASGGSVGYDHKKMGITARGAWEAVKRHFREIGTDIQTTPFTCVGVGDMSGDVFGNGMLQSPHTQLVAAFNHLHIFIDPNPDIAQSFKERQRLFAVAKGSWDAYDPALISKGGGVFSRKQKTIAISPEMKTRFGITRDELSPAELVRSLLAANVDLLWFGGIGTFVKTINETHAQVGDKANDSLRVDAEDIRAKVIGEGANLGVTQKARIAYAHAGGRINTDAIDNSAGVDTSDHEVNIKILFRGLLSSGAIDLQGRNKFLTEMTSDVGELVLADNYRQTQALTLMEAEGAAQLPALARFMRQIEKSGLLNRKVETLPDDESLKERERQGRGLTRPEAAVMLAYGKIWLKELLLKRALLDNPDLNEDLISYFPPALADRHRDQILNHQLRREITATLLVNDIVNRFGPHFVPDMAARTERDPEDIVIAVVLVHRGYELAAGWKTIDALDNKIPAAVQTDILLRQISMARQAVEVLLDMRAPNAAAIKISAEAEAIKSGIHAILSGSPVELPPGDESLNTLQKAGVSSDFLARLVLAPRLVEAPLAIAMASAKNADILTAAAVMSAVERRFGFDWVLPLAAALKPPTAAAREMLAITIADLRQTAQHLCKTLLGTKTLPSKEEMGEGDTGWIDAWLGKNQIIPASYDQLIIELRAAGSGAIETASLVLLARRLQDLLADRLTA